MRNLVFETRPSVSIFSRKRFFPSKRESAKIVATNTSLKYVSSEIDYC